MNAVSNSNNTSLPNTAAGFATYNELLASLKAANPGAVKQFAYTHPTTNQTLFYTVRFGQGEAAAQFEAYCNAEKRWVAGETTPKLPFYNRAALKNREVVVILENEETADKLTSFALNDFAATTVPRGIKGVPRVNWATIADQDVVIWRSNTPAGEHFEEEVYAALSATERKTTRITTVPDSVLMADSKKDVLGYLAAIKGTEQAKRLLLQLILQDGVPVNSVDVLAKHYEDIREGRFKTLKLPNAPKVSTLSKLGAPGSVTTICGTAGSGKSFFMLEAFWRLKVEQGVKVKLMMLEENIEFWQKRVISQMAHANCLADSDFLEQRESESYVTDQLKTFRNEIHSFTVSLKCPGEQSSQLTLTDIAEWVEYQANQGVELIGVDPVTMAKTSMQPWIDDQEFLYRVKKVLRKTGARLFLATHPRSGKAGTMDLSGVAGGAAYPRFSQVVLWLENLKGDGVTSEVWVGAKVEPRAHKQIMHILKTRSGKGSGAKIANHLDEQTIRLKEVGLIRPKAS